MQFADKIVIADIARLEQIDCRSKKDIIIITNSPKEEIVDPTLKHTDPNKKFTIFYGGGISQDRGIEQIISAIEDLEDVNLIVMGSCSNRLYQQKITELPKKNCNIEIFPQSVPHEIIMKYTLMADLLFILYDPAIPNNKFASPNKLFEAMRCNKPVLIK